MKYFLSPETLAELAVGELGQLDKWLQTHEGQIYFYAGWVAECENLVRNRIQSEQTEVPIQKFYDLIEKPILIQSALCSDHCGEGQSVKLRQWNSLVNRIQDDVSLVVTNNEIIGATERLLVTDFIDSWEKSDSESAIAFIDLEQQQRKIRGELESSIHRVLDHGRYIMGPEVKELEGKLAAYVGVEHCITVASGTDSLLIALMALGVGPGDEVVTVPFTWISTAEVIALLGATPVFVDIEPVGWNMDPDKLKSAITDRTKAIMPVGIFGQMAQMERINAIANESGNIPVIEDAAQCFGSMENRKRSCGVSTIGSTSFFPSKPLGCYGDGGALFTNDGELGDRMRQIRVHGQKKKHHHPILGLNGRLDTLQAAIVLEKLEIYNHEVIKRGEVAKSYEAMIAKAQIADCKVQGIIEGIESVYAQYTLSCQDRDTVASALRNHGVPSVSYYQTPLHLQGVFSGLGYSEGDFPISEKIAATTISVPMSPYLSVDEQERVVGALCSAGKSV